MLKKIVNSGEPILGAVGFRRVDGGWWCFECTRIPGELGRLIMETEGKNISVRLDEDGRVLDIYGSGGGTRSPE